MSCDICSATFGWDVRCPKHGLSEKDSRRPAIEVSQALKREARNRQFDRKGGDDDRA